MSDQPLYDEFGNYIGPDSDVDDASDYESSEYGGEAAAAASQEAVPMDTTEDGAPVEQRIVLAEDKKHYPDADEVYPEAEVVFQDEDTQPLTQPIIAPTKTFDFDKLEKEVPELVYDYHFLAGLMEHPSLIRNVAVVGGLHSGKTLLCDLLVSHTWADRNKKLGNLDKEELNSYIREECELMGLDKDDYVVSPIRGNLAFASGLYQFVFTTYSFAKYYVEANTEAFRTSGADQNNESNGLPAAFGRASQEGGLQPHQVNECARRLARGMWGDVWRDKKTGQFVKSPPKDQGEVQRTFVEFFLVPLYKMIGHTIGEEQESLQVTLGDVGIYLSQKDYYAKSTKSLLKKVLSQFFGGPQPLIDQIVAKLPSPQENAANKISKIYSGNQTSQIADDMRNLRANGELLVHTSKNYHRSDMSGFDLFGRVMSGTLRVGDKVKVLGERYTLDDPEDSKVETIEQLWIYEGRYRVEVSHVPAGNWVLIGGSLDSAVVKTSTIIAADNTDDVEICRPLKFATTGSVKIACEPLNPSELPKMLEGLRKIDRSFPLVQCKVEESGEHVIIGTGELYLDVILHDLRKLYGDIEIKVSDPVVPFCETVIETSQFKCSAESTNKQAKLYMIAEPLEKGIAEAIESGVVTGLTPTKERADIFGKQFGWDKLAARNIWAFGADPIHGTNVILNETLATDAEARNSLNLIRDSVVSGFQWATREGPLCEDNVRNVKFKLLDVVTTNAGGIGLGSGQIIPVARRVAYSSMLMATPRLMEPMMFAEIDCPADCVSAVYTVLSRRRGHVLKDVPRPGTPLFCVYAYIPSIETFGFETDLRTHTSGQAFGTTVFDHWSVVPGDPLDSSIILRPLEPAPQPHLAREFVIKTRRRKGIGEDINAHKYFDDPELVSGLSRVAR
ncbi:Snu114p GTpase, U5 snRNP-specific protein, 116 kDa, putative [Perkinsus marinus ATCC 50983]|uniref:Snu114p GTpase, U5 snRNP-specific protein, 116 kDa, putative n=1 Tax=Perkinsus marinus (strain ATCC 50983 / TXsc) TaxID=423536 RepID=C5K9Y9_PERM5|nr:Snu114p GTpase, U5 snRNP-specific protein, 116 kDa, putative [Perkinsus marinus ATCC 50983]EER18718.1 Snu114p GTpase, U5 snRNP-specific protein, 116 kDa, putative [Perkinsus marinus ATCC 50983]|eukprot:XP_002786922.1 Snu114p GTpase, U5 snRNP-specific protein, 116 kDa, putative [Perkinsus marinus ATCC 50983]